MRFRFIVIASLWVVPGASFAQAKPVTTPPTPAPQRFVFEDDLIPGNAASGEGNWVDVRTPVQHSSLIKIREEFRDKVLQSAGEF